MRVRLSAESVLPLTCTRSGTCCHGKLVWINPWELTGMAAFLGQSPADFADQHCEAGIRLRFTGPPGWRHLPACTLFAGEHGCRAHAARPLACRLYPLGRVVEADRAAYVHDGPEFPCLAGCPEVRTLPSLSVAEYLAGQQAQAGEAAQDAYRALVADLAEAAFAVVVDSGLLAQARTATVTAWRATARESADDRLTALAEWGPALLFPVIQADHASPTAWVADHREALRARLQTAFATLRRAAELSAASTTCLRLAVHVAQSLGGDPAQLIATWSARAEHLR